ncbi:MAG: diaminopimelate epimerase [Thiobacillaceae bacterium]
MKLHFTKMHGLGNDFVVFDGVNQTVNLTPEQLRRIADRHFGIGCDQILLVEKPTQPNVDFRYRIFNADGGEVSQCGNGARCFVRFVHEHGLTDKTAIRVETRSGIIEPRLLDNGDVLVNMGAPQFAPADIPFVAEHVANIYPFKVGDHLIQISALSMGNPHAVLRVNDLDTAPVTILGAAIESHPRFPERVNAGFMQVVNPHDIRLRVFERGAGETLACGSGACAAVVAGISNGWLETPVTVRTRGGDLTIEWAGQNQPVMMSGPATTVFEGTLEL